MKYTNPQTQTLTTNAVHLPETKRSIDLISVYKHETHRVIYIYIYIYLDGVNTLYSECCFHAIICIEAFRRHEMNDTTCRGIQRCAMKGGDVIAAGRLQPTQLKT